MADLPKWVWDMVIAMRYHEEFHGREDTCLKGVMAAIPGDVQKQAEGIATYVRLAQGNPIAEQAKQSWEDLAGSFFPMLKDNSADEVSDRD